MLSNHTSVLQAIKPLDDKGSFPITDLSVFSRPGVAVYVPQFIRYTSAQARIRGCPWENKLVPGCTISVLQYTVDGCPCVRVRLGNHLGYCSESLWLISSLRLSYVASR